ncbi:hypothetical protein EST38_g1696 [Candolleomyces aberdarensis]|uniref:tRNA dimethylallyltransferase n=1 Tax=Candolleomyces aberdarensis TaxID=2316362 RepID=A0A4Q2DVC9_9AGAR|nr:hypothetical protein EST38_g1696 [Candolleomyces aberdarensis]
MLKPLITVCGTTGVGKSKLAIELALHLAKKQFGDQGWRGARVINADSMQVYKGLDVITNKVPQSEMEGVEHLLMGFKDPGEQYVVGEWVEDSLKLINEMHQRKEVPIVVGGTSYWIQHLIFPNRLAKPNEAPSTSDALPWDPQLQDAIQALPPDLRTLFENLPQEPPSAKADPDAAFRLHSLLLLLDPSVGQRWHWKDTRKVLHSLTIIRSARRRASDIIAQQAGSSSASQPRFRTLCFWLFAEASYLEPRLDSRVDDMIEKGLLEEIRELRRIADAATQATVPESTSPQYDYTLGIYQAIGYKEFHNFLDNSSDSVFKESVERMKISTRQYAKKQISWIRNKLMPAVKEANAETDTVSLYLLDAAEVDERWEDRVQKPAIDVTEKLLLGESLPDPRSLSQVANDLLNTPNKSAK